jgi:hypothetical protein
VGALRHQAAVPNQLRKSSSAASHSLQQVADDDSFARSSRCPFPSPFHAGLSSGFKSTRMLAHQQSHVSSAFSQPVVRQNRVGFTVVESVLLKTPPAGGRSLCSQSI